MQIGAIVTIAGQARESSDGHALTMDGRSAPTSQELLGSPTVFWEVLGRSIIDRTLDRLHRVGIQYTSVVSESPEAQTSVIPGQILVASGEGFWTAWDRIVSRYLNEGIDLLLLARLGPYIELDIADLVHFHRGMHSDLTQVYDGRGALDLVLVEAEQLRKGSGSIRSRLSRLIPNRSRYRFHGYSNRLRDPLEFRSLVRDALLGRCDIHPVGSEVGPGVWTGANARIDASARLEAPCYIGEGTCVGPSCRVTDVSAIEKQCEVDAGTNVEDSCILAGTYVGMGLSVVHSVVAGPRLFHLHRNVELQLPDGRLIGQAAQPGLVRQGLLRSATSLLRRERKSGSSGLSTRSAGAASLVTSSRWLGRFSS